MNCQIKDCEFRNNVEGVCFSWNEETQECLNPQIALFTGLMKMFQGVVNK